MIMNWTEYATVYEVHSSHGETIQHGPGDVLGLSTDLAQSEHSLS